MKVGDKVTMRESPETEGIIRKLVGRQVLVRWSEHTSTTVSRYLLKPYQPKGEGVNHG